MRVLLFLFIVGNLVACANSQVGIGSKSPSNEEMECRLELEEIEMAIKVLYRKKIINDLDLKDTLFINLSSSLSVLKADFPKKIYLGNHEMTPKFGLNGSPLLSFFRPSLRSSVDSIRILSYHVKYVPGGSYYGNILFRCVNGNLHFESIPRRSSREY